MAEPTILLTRKQPLGSLREAAGPVVIFLVSTAGRTAVPLVPQLQQPPLRLA